jgi:hypothetical protein
MLKSLIGSIVLLCLSAAAMAQQVNRLDCQGWLSGSAAVISGMRQFTQTSALGDGYVRFQGSIAAAGMQGRIAYEGYTATAPFEGLMVGPLGQMSIGVLDNTGGRMIIYGGTPSLGAPNTLGEFVCNWQ